MPSSFSAPPGFVPENLWLIGGNCVLTFIGLRFINTLAEGLRKEPKDQSQRWYWRLARFLGSRPWYIFGKNLHSPGNWTVVRRFHAGALVFYDMVLFWPLLPYILPPLRRSIVMLGVFAVAGLVLKRFIELVQRFRDEGDKNSVRMYAVAVAAGCAFFTMIGFAYSVYPYVPAERGGGNYAHVATVVLQLSAGTIVPTDFRDKTAQATDRAAKAGSDENKDDKLADNIQKNSATTQLTTDLIIVEQTGSWVYVALPPGSCDPAVWRPQIISLPIAAVQAIDVHNEIRGQGGKGRQVDCPR